MSTAFIGQGIWSHLTKAVRDSRKPCAIAVAYFGKGAGRLLPLPAGSHLVVDASERAVASGQTCPADLSKLVKRRVRVFTVPNLHAKVFVLERVAYVGSANISSRSASQLVEAVIRTTDSGAVRAARKFVRDHCLHELSPAALRQLSKLYRPPHVPGGKRGKRIVKDTVDRPTLPRVLLAKLHREEWSVQDQSLHDAALVVAKKRRKRPRSFELDSFRLTGKCTYKRNDVVIQVIEEGDGRTLVTPPGNVLHVRTRRNGQRQVTFVYLEHPARRRRQIKTLARSLGHGALKRLQRDGRVRDVEFSRILLKAWAD